MELIDYSGELLLNLIVNFPTRFPDYDSHISALLDLFISSESSILSAEAFPPFRNYNLVAVSVSIDFPSNSKGDASAEDYSCANWDSPRDHLWGVLWEDIFMAFFTLNFGENFWFSKNFLKGVGVVFILRGECI